MTAAERIAAMIAAHEADMAAILSVKPAAADGRSDGRRVRYVRAETAAATLRAVLALIDGKNLENRENPKSRAY